MVTMGEMEVAKKSKSVLVEEDGGGAESKKKNQESEIDLMFKVLRGDPDVGGDNILRNLLLPMTLYVEHLYIPSSSRLTLCSSSNMDREVR